MMTRDVCCGQAQRITGDQESCDRKEVTRARYTKETTGLRTQARIALTSDIRQRIRL
jgi:hypothetical protein